jgi:hypothetical protein
MVRSRRSLLAVACALLVPAALACNAIIGLDDFKRAECDGFRCDGGGAPDVVVPDGSQPVDASPDAPRGTDPVSWAQWKMPAWDAGADATAVGIPPSYSIVDDDVVADDITGLTWRRAVLATPMTFAAADAACRALDPASGPWRLPKRIELVSILDYGRPGIKVDPIFGGVQNLPVWTSSEVRTDFGVTGTYWTINFGDGTLATTDPGLSATVLCVKAK